MKIYLDNCAIQRPFDDKRQLRIAVEAEAILGILQLIESGKIDLLSSDILTYEVEKTPNMNRRDAAVEVLNFASKRIEMNETVQKNASNFVDLGIDPLDALHIASAVQASADYFCTCDDKLLKNSTALRNLNIKIVPPVESVTELNNEY